MTTRTGRRTSQGLACVLLAITLAACGGGDFSVTIGSPSGGTTGGASGGTSGSATVAVSGLAGNEFVTLLDNGADPETFKANGTTAFPASWTASSSYAITVQSHSPGVACAVANPSSGTLGAADVTVNVSCASGSLSILYSFGTTPTDGQKPFAGLVMGSAGNLYGTTVGAGGKGTIFKLDASNAETTVYSFGAPSDGRFAYGGVITDSSGNLYGATTGGGASDNGTVFKLSPGAGGYTETFRYSFGAPPNGKWPYAGLVMDGTGNLYGTTFYGGKHGGGTVFRITPAGAETTPHVDDFSGGSDGSNPYGSLITDSSGNLYGTTTAGGASGRGTVFKLAPDGTKTVLHIFGASPDGKHPYAGLLMGDAGNLYGTTRDGGANGRGTVFKLTPGAGGYTETVLYSFGVSPDGSQPYAGVIMDDSGSLYGTTYGGGASGKGTVFEIAPDGTETILHDFGASGSDGQYPVGGLIMDGAGNLYGTTVAGGDHGKGAVFRID